MSLSAHPLLLLALASAPCALVGVSVSGCAASETEEDQEVTGDALTQPQMAFVRASFRGDLDLLRSLEEGIDDPTVRERMLRTGSLAQGIACGPAKAEGSNVFSDCTLTGLVRADGVKNGDDEIVEEATTAVPVTFTLRGEIASTLATIVADERDVGPLTCGQAGNRTDRIHCATTRLVSATVVPFRPANARDRYAIETSLDRP